MFGVVCYWSRRHPNHYIQSQGGLARFISYQLSQNDQDIVIIAEQADFQIDSTAQQLELSIMDVSISQHDQHLDMPRPNLHLAGLCCRLPERD